MSPPDRSVATVLLALSALVATAGCKAKIPAITEPFSDDFERAVPGPSWYNTGAEYGIFKGKLTVAHAYNHPLWLRQKLPRDAVVEVDVMSKSPEGDLKIELYGDGTSFDPDKGRYDPSGYVFIFGGWGNSLSVIGKKGEHEEGVKVKRASPRVEPGRTYHYTITRKGAELDWRIDGEPFLSWTDPEPLAGEGYEFFGVNNWEAEVYFDNLKIRPAR